jgi:Uma2 family endonuclease
MNAALKYPDYFTYGDYSRWSEDERWELIDGQAYAMSAPSRLHQEIIFEVGRQIGNYLKGKSCKGYVAPFDVRLPKNNEKDDKVDTVVQPDISVICDKNKLDDKGCRGAPDWVIEILSPSTATRDMDVKHQLYQQHGVKEYWIISSTEKWGMKYILNEHQMYDPPKIFSLSETTQVSLFPDLLIEWDFLSLES